MSSYESLTMQNLEMCIVYDQLRKLGIFDKKNIPPVTLDFHHPKIRSSVSMSFSIDTTEERVIEVIHLGPYAQSSGPIYQIEEMTYLGSQAYPFETIMRVLKVVQGWLIDELVPLPLTEKPLREELVRDSPKFNAGSALEALLTESPVEENHW